MKRKTVIATLFVLAIALAAILTSCRKTQTLSPIVGHWGCEQYVSCRTDSLGHEQWDTLYFEVATGGDYELFFNTDGTGKLKLGNSPAFIKEFPCTYEYDSEAKVLAIESSSWLYALYGAIYLDENHAEFDVESLTETTFVASWTNRLSEPQPFFEKFFIKRINP